MTFEVPREYTCENNFKDIMRQCWAIVNYLTAQHAWRGTTTDISDAQRYESAEFHGCGQQSFFIAIDNGIILIKFTAPDFDNRIVKIESIRLLDKEMSFNGQEVPIEGIESFVMSRLLPAMPDDKEIEKFRKKAYAPWWKRIFM